MRFTEASDRPWICGMNLLVTVAVVLTYPVQFYPAIEIIEKKLGLVYEEEDDGVHIPLMVLSPPDEDELLESPGALDALLAASDDALDRVCEVEGAAEEVPTQPASPNEQVANDAATAPSEEPEESKSDAANLEARALSQSEQQAILSSAADMLEAEWPESPPSAMIMSFDPNELGELGSVAGATTALTWRRCLARCSCVLGTLVVAASVPNLELVISLCGSLNAPLLVMILPPLMAFKVLDPDEADGGIGMARKPLHLSIAAIGIVGCVTGTVVAVKAILEEMFDL